MAGGIAAIPIPSIAMRMSVAIDALAKIRG
jgi:hypothetical protein